jgi:hypothetical protein
MDSQERDESKVRQREEMLVRRVGEALDHLQPNVTAECPDAEVIAAYAEQTLGAVESEKWEAHFATCSRCRKILRVLAASTDTPLADKEVARLGELVSATRSPAEITGNSEGRPRPRIVEWRTRWLAPALGVAAVLAVWFAMRPPWRTTDRASSPTLVAQAPKEEVSPNTSPAETDRLLRVAPQQVQKGAPPPAPERFSADTQPFNAPAVAPSKRRAEAGNEIERISPGPSDAADSLAEKKKLDGLPIGRETRPAVVPAVPPPSPRAQAAMEAPTAPQSRAKDEFDKADKQALQDKTKASAMANAPSGEKEGVAAQNGAGATTAGAVEQQAPAESRSNIRSDQGLTVFRSTQKYSSLLKAPSASTLWRAGKGGIIEHSTDAGKTWASQASPSQQDWLAGAPVSDTVCWLVGRNGAIARTMDGERWERVAPPAQAADASGKLPDWTGVAAGDSQSATITASDGRRFATQDGGKTWQTQP